MPTLDKIRTPIHSYHIVAQIHTMREQGPLRACITMRTLDSELGGHVIDFSGQTASLDACVVGSVVLALGGALGLLELCSWGSGLGKREALLLDKMSEVGDTNSEPVADCGVG